MRFTEFLIETAPRQGRLFPNPPTPRKDKKARDQRTRRANQQRAAQNQNARPGVAAPTNAPLPQRPAAQMPTIDINTGKEIKPEKQNPAGPKRPVAGGSHTVDFDYIPQQVQDAAKKDRTQAVELITLLGAMYQTKRRNPSVQMTTPAMVTQSKNKGNMEALFKAAKDLDLGQLAKMSQDLKNVAAAPGTQNVGGAAPAGTGNVPQTPGQTPAAKTMLQKLYNMIAAATKNLSPADFGVLRKKIDKAAQKAKPNPPGNPQPQIKPVVTQG